MRGRGVKLEKYFIVTNDCNFAKLLFIYRLGYNIIVCVLGPLLFFWATLTATP